MKTHLSIKDSSIAVRAAQQCRHRSYQLQLVFYDDDTLTLPHTAIFETCPYLSVSHFILLPRFIPMLDNVDALKYAHLVRIIFVEVSQTLKGGGR